MSRVGITDSDANKFGPARAGRITMADIYSMTGEEISIDLLISNQEPAVQSFGSMLAWCPVDGGVAVRDDLTHEEFCRVSTRFPSRDGLRMIDAIIAAGEGGHYQVGAHGCGKTSIQSFAADGRLSADVNLGQ